nr:hypothetical protein [Tanacetum cinerariifolium]
EDGPPVMPKDPYAYVVAAFQALPSPNYEEALTTLEGVNTKVTELATVKKQDTQDIYDVMEDTQENGTKESGPKANYKVKPGCNIKPKLSTINQCKPNW